MQPNFGNLPEWRKIRRKSTIILNNEVRRNSRTYLSDGRLLYAINLIPFQDGMGLHHWPSSGTGTSVSATSLALLQSKRKHSSSLLAHALFGDGLRHRPLDRNRLKLHKGNGRRFLLRFTAILQTLYDKSRFHYFLPIIILVLYSVLGGAIFYYIENSAEQKVLLRKKEFVEREEKGILEEIHSIERRLRAFTTLYANFEYRNREIRRFRIYARNRLDKAIYWYVLQTYYLNDQETYKSSLLHPSHDKAEPLWREHMATSFKRIFALKNYTEQLSERCWEIGSEYNSTKKWRLRQLRKSVDEFNVLTGLQYVLKWKILTTEFLKPTWTFWNSMFLAVTTYSTIGYGNITPKTNLGKLAAMVYAVIGIPLLLMILHKLGRFSLLCLQHFWNYLRWFAKFMNCMRNAGKNDGDGGPKDRRSSAAGDSDESLSMDESRSQMPVLLAIGVAFSWMFLCAAIFLKFESDWDYFKSFYFFFCSLTTIGYGCTAFFEKNVFTKYITGDVTPTHSEDMFIIFGFIIIGLSLVSMCINVIQIKLEELFEEVLLTMMEEYANTQAAEGFLADEIKPMKLPKMGVVDLWKMWKLRHRRTTIQQVCPQSEEPEDAILHPFDHQISNSIAPSSPLPRRTLFDSTLRRFFFPSFYDERRRRTLLLEKLQRRLNQREKAVQTDFHCNCYHYFPSASHRLSMPLRSGGPNASKINQQPFQLLKSKFSIKKKPFTSNQNQNSLYFYNSPLVPMHSTVGPQRPPHQILHFKEDEEDAESCYTEPLSNIPITSDEVMPLKPDSPLSSNSGSSTPSDKKNLFTATALGKAAKVLLATSVRVYTFDFAHMSPSFSYASSNRSSLDDLNLGSEPNTQRSRIFTSGMRLVTMFSTESSSPLTSPSSASPIAAASSSLSQSESSQSLHYGSFSEEKGSPLAEKPRRQSKSEFIMASTGDGSDMPTQTLVQRRQSIAQLPQHQRRPLTVSFANYTTGGRNSLGICEEGIDEAVNETETSDSKTAVTAKTSLQRKIYPSEEIGSIPVTARDINLIKRMSEISGSTKQGPSKIVRASNEDEPKSKLNG